MSWVTAIWAMLIGASMAMALPHFLVGIWQRRGAHLFFGGAAAAVIGIAAGELLMMRAGSVDQFALALRYTHVPIFVLVVALVGFVHLYFGSGRLWLGLTVCGARLVCLVLNFVYWPNLSFHVITALRPLKFLGETVSAPVGIISWRTYLSQLSSLLLLIFVVDASVNLWRQGGPEARRRALVVGATTAFFILVAAGTTALTHAHILEAPYVVSLCFGGVLMAIAFELGSDLFRAGQIAQKLEASEASLSESEARFGIAADAAPVLIWLSGLDKLCTFFNKAWLDFTGRTMTQELGNGWTTGVHADDLERCFKAYGSSFDAREPFVLQYRLRNHNGEYRWITDNGVPRYDAQGNFLGYVGACVDITDLLKKERALNESEERVALAAEVAHLGVWELDTRTNEVWLSDKARELFQFGPETTISYTQFQDRVHPEDRSVRDATIQRAIKTLGGYEIEYRTLLPDGTVRWIGGRARCVKGEDGEGTRLLGVSMDVTERKEAQELFQLATEASPSGTLLVDSHGRIVLSNAHVQKFFGYEREELIGKPIEVLVPERFVAEHRNYRAKFMAEPQARAMGAGRELFARRKDGTEFPVEVGLNPIQTPRGLLVLASVTDISPRKRAEAEARRQREQINLLSRVSLLGEMAASLAHELNQPLSAIISNANAGMRFIDQGKGDPETLREILVDVGADGHRAHNIIGNVRNTIKKGTVIRQPISLNEVVMNVTHMLRADEAAGFCEVQILLADNLPVVEGDPTQIQQVLINLLGNAFDAMRDTPLNRRKVELTAERNGDETIRITVRDYGAGISDEAQERLFERFFTTKEDGLGMGLAIVRSIIESHGGKIDAENVEGGGARFFFTLPTSTIT